jgi:hypothetical protein
MSLPVNVGFGVGLDGHGFRSVRNKADPWSAASHAANNTFRILSLDGGGVRGVMTLVVLARIAREYPAFLDRHVDLIAGTSTGGLIGLLLAAGYSVEECLEIYKVRLIPLRFPGPAAGNIDENLV